ncbi:MAG: peptide MFS transporter [Verrucomicrobia bacterium]|nr:peptide MFS transporter [Cytophagales bacterium]
MADNFKADYLKQPTFFGHPIGLSVLFFTEMWERFSFYGMRALLVLFLVAKTEKGGYGWDKADALELYAWYLGLVYFMSLPGGFIADRLLGQKKSVVAGGILLCIGHLMLAFEPQWAFFTGLVLIICGVGMLKPNISTMVGGLYKPGDPRRDAGFTVFYMGINLGSLMATILVGWIGERYGWHYGFGLAGIGMVIGQLVFMWGQKYLTEVGNFIPKTVQNLSDASKTTFTQQEKDRIVVLLIAFLIVVVFWAAFEQAGGLMNLYTDEYTRRNIFGIDIPASVFQSLNPGYIILFGGVMAALWLSLEKRGKAIPAIARMGLGTVIMGMGFIAMVGATLERNEVGNSSAGWLFLAYFLHTIGELMSSPVSLSFITKVSPKRIVASMMGIYWAATGLGSFAAGKLGKLAMQLGDLNVFAGIAIFTIIMGLLITLFTKRINKLAHGAEQGKASDQIKEMQEA